MLWSQKPASLAEEHSKRFFFHRVKEGQTEISRIFGGEAGQMRGSDQKGPTGKCPAVVSDFQESE